MNLKADDVISLEGKTEFGKNFVKEKEESDKKLGDSLYQSLLHFDSMQ